VDGATLRRYFRESVNITGDSGYTFDSVDVRLLGPKHERRCQYTTSVNGDTYLFALVLRRFGILETSLVFAASFASPLEAVVCSTRRPVRLVDAMAIPGVVAAVSCIKP